jgi:hypothetical protein
VRSSKPRRAPARGGGPVGIAGVVGQQRAPAARPDAGEQREGERTLAVGERRFEPGVRAGGK